MNPTHVSTGYQIGLWVTIIIVAACLLATALGLRLAVTNRGNGWLGIAMIPVGVAVVTAGIFVAVAFPPFSAQYHTYVRHSGEVYSVDSRLLGQNKSTTQQFPIVFTDDRTDVYRCDDSRCATVRKGDRITLDCIRDFQLNATPGWKCNFVSVDSRSEGGTS